MVKKCHSFSKEIFFGKMSKLNKRTKIKLTQAGSDKGYSLAYICYIIK